MKKIFIIIIIILISTNAWAVIVTGSGTTKETAINNGLREAVEMFTSTFVYSVTDVENYQLQKDQIVAASTGYVKKYKIVKISKIDDLILVTLDVTLSEDKIEYVLRSNINMVTVEDVTKDYNNIVQRQDQMRKLIDMLRILYERPIHEKYIITYEGYKINRIGLNDVDLNIITRIQINPFYRKVNHEIINLLEEPEQKQKPFHYVLSNFYINGGKIAFEKKQHVSGDIPLRWIDLVEAQIKIDGKLVDSCRSYEDNRLVNIDVGESISVILKSIFTETNYGKFLPPNEQKSRIIPPEGLVYTVKHKIQNLELKNLQNLDVKLEYCGMRLRY